MPAKSTSQQKLMGMVHAAQTGQIKNPSEKVAKLAKSMTKKSASDYASTKYKGLPKKVKKTKKVVKELSDKTICVIAGYLPYQIGSVIKQLKRNNIPHTIEKRSLRYKGSEGVDLFVKESDLDTAIKKNLIMKLKKQWGEKQADSIKENYENKVGQLHMVQKPSAGCNVASMVYEVDPISGIQQHGVDAQTVHGVYSTPEEAQKVAEKLYNEHMTGMKKLEEKKGTVANKLNKAITALEKKHKGLMETAKANPAQASSHKAAIAEIQSKIQELMDKLEMVEKSKKPIETEEDEKKTLKENEGGDLQAFQKMLDSHDWYYMMSDSPRTYDNGIRQASDIKKMMNSLGEPGKQAYKAALIKRFPNAKVDEKKTLKENEGNLQTLSKLLNAHDWYYSFSDDPRVYSKGTQELDQITKLAKQLGDEGIKMYVTKFKEKFSNADVDSLTKSMKGQSSISEAFDSDYGPIEALGDQVEKALFKYIEAFDYELGDDEQIKEDVAVLVDKIVDKYINSAYSTNENKEESYKVGDIIVVNKGPHKGVKHKIIHVSGDGKYNIQPILSPGSKNKYRLGAASASSDDFEK